LNLKVSALPLNTSLALRLTTSPCATSPSSAGSPSTNTASSRKRQGKKVAGETEEGVYEAVGLLWIPPELREDRGELEAAAKGTLPRLVTLEDIRGETHAHTKWSDGFATVEEMARAAMERGYEYIAITDHSPPMGWGVKPEDFKRLIREIRMVSDKLGFPILAGIEVDIAPDGSLHMDEEVLRQLDIIIAAVHSAMRMDINAIDPPNRQGNGEPACPHHQSPNRQAHQPKTTV